MIWSLLKALVPKELTLRELSKSFVGTLDSSDFPGDIDDLEDFKERLVAYRVAAGDFALQSGRETNPGRKVQLEKLAATSRQNLRILRATEGDILDRAGYTRTREEISGLLVPILSGAIVAVAGVSVYLLASSGPAAKGTSAPASELGILIESETTAGNQLWQALGLAGCETTPGKVPVLVSGGKGTDSDPYAVQTVTTSSSCPSMTFSVSSNAATISIPRPTKITVTYRPSPAGS